MPTQFPVNHDRRLSFTPKSFVPPVPPSPRNGLNADLLSDDHRTRNHARSTPSCCNGESVTVDVEDDVRLLWVLRDVLGVTGPKYGCGINVCKACTSHINGKAFNPCAVPVGASAR